MSGNDERFVQVNKLPICDMCDLREPFWFFSTVECAVYAVIVEDKNGIHIRDRGPRITKRSRSRWMCWHCHREAENMEQSILNEAYVLWWFHNERE